MVKAEILPWNIHVFVAFGVENCINITVIPQSINLHKQGHN